MNLYDYCDAINADIEVHYCNHRNPRWYASLKHCEIKCDGVLIGVLGDGDTSEEAIKDMVNKINGKQIVFDAYNKKYRREFDVPTTLTL